jgi:hypothetical protein
MTALTATVRLPHQESRRNYARDLDTDRRRGTWLDPAAAKKPLAEWAAVWIDTLDVEPRTDENYRRYLRNHILPHSGTTALGDITALAVTEWWKQLRRRGRRRDHTPTTGERVWAMPEHIIRIAEQATTRDSRTTNPPTNRNP